MRPFICINLMWRGDGHSRLLATVHRIRDRLPLAGLALPHREEHHREVFVRCGAVPVVRAARNEGAIPYTQLLDRLPLNLQAPSSSLDERPAVCICQVAFRAPASKPRRPTVYPVVSRVVVFPIKPRAGPRTPRGEPGGAGAAPSCCAYAPQTMVSASKTDIPEMRAMGEMSSAGIIRGSSTASA